MSLRDELLVKLRTQSFDVLVIGGGIVGAGIARDAAMRGLRVALVEKGDFASGTSSKTSKLIHGGLRYLEHGRLGLVFESLRERRILRTIAPQLVWPLSLMMPVYRGDPRARWKIAAGLTLYDWLAWQDRLGGPRMLSATKAREHEPWLAAEGLRGAGSYTDCQMDDARLCLANILQAIQFGAACGNYVKLLALEQAKGRLCGAAVEDVRTGQQFDVRAAVIVNAAGPWADTVRRMSDRTAGPRLAPTKGIHLVVPRLTTQPLFVQHRRDRRMIFVLPWGGDYSLIGTTESSGIADLDALRATGSEVEYLLEAVNRVLLPAHRLHGSDVVATFAGARPLLAFSGSSTKASREYRLEIDQQGLVSVLGGKYTTYRLMAKQAVDLISRRLRPTPERCLTDQVGLLEPAHPVALNRWQDVTARLAPDLLARLLTRYGTGAFRILELLAFDPQLAQPVCPHHDVLQAELVYAIREELACTVSDVLFRRTRMAYSACQGLDLLSTITELFQRYGRLSREQVEEQVEQYQQQLAAGLAFRPQLTHTFLPS